MNSHVGISLKERSTSVSVEGNFGIGEPELAISEILFDFRINRWRFGSFVRDSRLDREEIWLSSSIRSVMVSLRVCGVSVV